MPWVDRVRQFVGAAALPFAEKMADVVKPKLYRNRQAVEEADKGIAH